MFKKLPRRRRGVIAAVAAAAAVPIGFSAITMLPATAGDGIAAITKPEIYVR
jgi:hypothetical protein